MKLLRLIIQPRHNLVGDVGRFDPTELICKNDLPEEADDDEEQGGRSGNGSLSRPPTRSRNGIPMTSRAWYFSIEPRRRAATTAGAPNAEQEEGN